MMEYITTFWNDKYAHCITCTNSHVLHLYIFPVKWLRETLKCNGSWKVTFGSDKLYCKVIKEI